MSEYRNRRQRTLQGGEAGTPHSQFPMQQNEHAIYSWSYVRCEAGRLGLKYTSKREETSIPPMLSADKPLDCLSPEIPTAGVDEAAEEEKGCGGPG